MGPFELTDLVGVDVNFEVAKSFWEQSSHEPRWQPHPIQAQMVAAGRLGRKSDRGYYDYSNGPHRPEDPDPHRRSAAEPDSEAKLIALDAGSLAALAAAEDAVGYLALPDLESATLVELTRADRDQRGDRSAAEAHFRALGKHVEWVGDAPGLVLGRIVCQLVNEAHFALDAGIASSRGHRHRDAAWVQLPARALRVVRGDRGRAGAQVLDGLHRELGEERYRAAPSLRAAAQGAAG